MFEIYNRRYTGNKQKLMTWIGKQIKLYCKDSSSLFDVFAGTGSVTNYFINDYKRFVINDFLYSNNVIYNAFFLQEQHDNKKIKNICEEYNTKVCEESNYISDNFGDKYFSLSDAKKIGCIREDIESKYLANEINYKEYTILLSSLIYSLDRISNTVGHYEAYIKNTKIKDVFKYELIKPIKLSKEQEIEIYKEDSNELSKRIKADIAFIDPPYNSRQYSRFYHLLETVIKWEKEELFGTAMKPKEENMSEYCKSKAVKAFEELINNLNTKYIVVTYNNTYTSKSSSSQNKITLEQIKTILSKKGKTKIFEQSYKAFNAGKTELDGHKEYLFITKVVDSKEEIDIKPVRSPFFYVGDKYKLMPQLQKLFPKNINNYIEPFVGGGSSFLNTNANKYTLNDLNTYIVNLHEEFIKYRKKPNELFDKLFKLVEEYNLSCSYKGQQVPEELKKKYVKTYYAKFNKSSYEKLRKDFNSNKDNNMLLYLLLIYGFNHMVRFNGSGDFNLPVGNVDFNNNVYQALQNYLMLTRDKDIKFYNMDFVKFIKSIKFEKDDYVFLDPPYLISSCEYNKMWNEEREKELFNILDELNEKGVRFGITNLIYHKGNENHLFDAWSKKYFVYNIDSNYISFNDNTNKKITSKEVFVTNYETKNRK